MTELVGKGRPFYSALDSALETLPEKASPEQVVNHLLKLGVKPQELIDRRMDQSIGAPLIPRERTVKFKKPDNKGRTEIVEPYFETTSVKGAKAIPREMVQELARKNPPPRIKEKMLEGVNDDHIQKLIVNAARDAALEQLGRRTPRNSEEYENFMESFIDDANNYDWNKYRDQAHELMEEGMLPGMPQHQDYTLPGGENYREMLIKQPGKDVFAVPQHYNDEPNILASMRLKDRTGPNGEKLLHLEELQSDWHQQGREHGYQQNLTELPPEYKLEKTKLGDYQVIDKDGIVRSSGLSPETATKNALENLNKGKRAPDAPFKKNWEEMAIKRLIHHAAEKGYHGIVMTPGKEQAERYGLSKKLHQLNVYKHKNGKYTLSGYIHGQDTTENPEVEQNEIAEEKLKDYIGQELAKKAIEQGGGQYRGIDLDVGGEGMKGFYDKKVPNIFNAVGKRHGVKMQLHGHTLPGHESERGEASERLGMQDRPLSLMTSDEVRNFNAMLDKSNEKHLHHFPITEPMRQDVLKNGLPLYNTGGVIHKAEGGNVQPSIEQMRMALNQNKFMVPKADIQSIGANEAPSMQSKVYISPGHDGNPAVGGVDMNAIAPGMQMMKQDQPAMTPPNQQPPSGQPQQSPLGGSSTSPLGAPPSNILQMTPQGQAMSAMTPPKQLQPQGLAKGGQPKGYLQSTPKNPHPLVGVRHKSTPQGNLAQRIAFDLFKHEGKGSIVPVPYDATSRDNLVTHVSGHRLRKPLLTEAGFDYSMDPNHIVQNIGGASGLQIAGRVQDRINQAGDEHGGDVFLLPNTMGENAENFSHHPAHIVLDLLRQRKLEPHILDALTHDLRSQHELVEDKQTKKKYRVYPYQNFVGFGHPKMEEQIMSGGHGLDTSAGNLRKKLMDRLGGVNMQKLLNYNIADLKGAILDPDLATDPKGYMGRTVVKAQPNAPLRLSKHGSYDTDYAGQYQGNMHNRPIELLMPDVYSNIHQELTGLKKNEGKSDPQMRAQVVGAIEKRKQGIAQPINSRVINNAGLYEEGLKQGEFDPKNLESVLAYYKRRGGFKKGGKVSQDTMLLKLMSKPKKAKK